MKKLDSKDALEILNIFKQYNLPKKEFINLGELMKDVPKSNIKIKYLNELDKNK